VSGSGISWNICKSAPRSRQITTPAPHYSVFLEAGCPSCRPTNSVKALKTSSLHRLNPLHRIYNSVDSRGKIIELAEHWRIIWFSTDQLWEHVNHLTGFWQWWKQQPASEQHYTAITTVCVKCWPSWGPSSHTHTHPFNGPFSGNTRVSRHQKDRTNLDFTEARDSEWQWHQLGHMQVCTSLQIDNHTSTPPLSFL